MVSHLLFNKIRNDIRFKLKNYKAIAIWGAGGFGIAALNLYEIPAVKIGFYIDSDPQKWGMEYITNSLPIKSPEDAKEPPPDLIIAASMYGKGILNAKKQYGFNCPVLLLSPRILLHC